eukprot:COSAG01_NODE_401_length_17529_cov_47.865806_1_plen_145_part_00
MNLSQSGRTGGASVHATLIDHHHGRQVQRHSVLCEQLCASLALQRREIERAAVMIEHKLDKPRAEQAYPVEQNHGAWCRRRQSGWLCVELRSRRPGRSCGILAGRLSERCLELVQRREDGVGGRRAPADGERVDRLVTQRRELL